MKKGSYLHLIFVEIVFSRIFETASVSLRYAPMSTDSHYRFEMKQKNETHSLPFFNIKEISRFKSLILFKQDFFWKCVGKLQMEWQILTFYICYFVGLLLKLKDLDFCHVVTAIRFFYIVIRWGENVFEFRSYLTSSPKKT